VMNSKLGLDVEIATYRKLLEVEESRWGQTLWGPFTSLLRAGRVPHWSRTLQAERVQTGISSNWSCRSTISPFYR
jgi:hypothetical protein